jgi:hypothetical protein
MPIRYRYHADQVTVTTEECDEECAEEELAPGVWRPTAIRPEEPTDDTPAPVEQDHLPETILDVYGTEPRPEPRPEPDEPEPEPEPEPDPPARGRTPVR